MTDSQKIFENYKPLKNHFSKLSLVESLHVIWAYSQNFSFNSEMPQDIQVAKYFIDTEDFIEKKFFPWELEIILREVIINSPDRRNKKSLREWDYLRKIVNQLKDFENKISEIYSERRNVYVELFRVAHRQFPLQNKIDTKDLIRHYKIFSDKDLKPIVENELNITVDKLYIIGLMFSGFFLKSHNLIYPFKSDISIIDKTSIDSFLKLFSIDFSELKEFYDNNKQFNDKFAYSFNPLRARPIIKKENTKGVITLYAPIPLLILFKLTSGIYYNLVNSNKKFGEKFGIAFENYVGDFCISQKLNDNFKLIKGEKYKIGKREKETVDWIIEEKSSLLFIECKTKRLKNIAKEGLEDEQPIKLEIKKMAEFVFQVYKSIKDFKENKYPRIKYNSQQEIFPIILTLEEWYLFGNFTDEELFKEIENLFSQNDLPKDYLEEMPFTIISTRDFELLIPVIKEVGIREVFKEKLLNKETKSWNMGIYLSNAFPKLINNNDKTFQEDALDKLINQVKP